MPSVATPVSGVPVESANAERQRGTPETGVATRRLFRVAFVALLLAAVFPLAAAGRAPLVVPLWPDLAPVGEELVDERSANPSRPDRSLRNVTFPELTVTWPRDAAENASAVVVCPGGGYARVNIDKGHETAKWLNELGFVAAVLKYRLPAPGAKQLAIPLPIQDGRQAVRLLRLNARQWGVDPDRVGILGSSAGGHLAAIVATWDAPSVATPVSGVPGESANYARATNTERQRGTPETGVATRAVPGESADAPGARPDFQMLLCPVISFDAAIAHAGSRRNLLGKNPSAARVRRYSAELQVTKDTPPAFLVHAEDDEVVVLANSLRYRDALQRAGEPVEMLVLKTGGHGFYLGVPGTDSEHWTEAGAAWLKQWSNPAQKTSP